MESLKGFPTLEERKTVLDGLIAKMPDKADRTELARRANEDFQRLGQMRDGKDAVIARDYREHVREKGLLPSQALAGIAILPDLSDKGRETLTRSFSAEAQTVTPRNTGEKIALFRAIDRGEITDRQALETFAFNHGLTDRQREEAEGRLAAGGNKGMLTVDKVERAWRALHNDAAQARRAFPPELYELVTEDLGPGNNPDVGEVKKSISRLHEEGVFIPSTAAIQPEEPGTEGIPSWLRNISLGTRDTIEGVVGLADIPLTLTREPMNWINGAFGGDPHLIKPIAPTMANWLGLAKPETPGEELASAIRQGVVTLPVAWGAGAAMKTQKAATALPTLTQAAGKMLSATPKADVAATVASATAGTLAQQAGAGPLGTMAAAVAGGMAGGKAVPGGAQIVTGSKIAGASNSVDDAEKAAADAEAKAARTAQQITHSYPVKTPQDFASWVKTKPQEAYAAYTERFGNTLDVDNARELCEAYGVNRAGRIANTEAVHTSASRLINGLFEQKLKEAPGPGQRNIVTFTAGAGGSGKSTAIRNSSDIAQRLEYSQIIYDTTFAGSGALKKIEHVLASGKDIDILYVARDPLKAIVSTFHRAQETGRYVPLDALVKGHMDALANIRTALTKYTGDKRVQILFFNNTGKTSTGVTDIAILEHLNYDNLAQRAQNALEQELRNGNISEEVYNRILHGTR